MSDLGAASIRSTRRGRGWRPGRSAWRFACLMLLLLIVLPNVEYAIFRHLTLTEYQTDFTGRDNFPLFFECASRLGHWYFNSWIVYSWLVGLTVIAALVCRNMHSSRRKYFMGILVILALIFSAVIGYAGFVIAHRISTAVG